MGPENPRKDTLTFDVPKRSVAGQRTVLVVDDDEMFARSVKRLLESAGYGVTTAGDGNAAIEMIRRQAFDVILSDIQMPGMNGIDLLGVVRAYDVDVPVILMSGAPTVDTAMEAISLRALQYLPKPVPHQAMLSAIDRASRMHRTAGERSDLQTRFERALETMWMAFQPIVESSGGALYGYEALMRSGEPSLAQPGDVLDAAERLGRTRDLGRRVRALSAAAFERAPRGAVLFVNLHGLDLLDPALYRDDEPLGRFADRVVLEVTERGAIHDVKDIRARVSVLRYHGYRVAIDDLGSGYAGLSSLVALEPEVVKLDISLVRGAHQSAVQQRLIRSMTAFCDQTRVRVVAEGVETAEERDCIRDCGCHLAQGYLFAKPGPPFPVPAVIR